MCHVLVIEDEWLIAEYLCHLVEEEGATSINVAVSEPEAVALAAARAPAIILSDVKLLEGTGPAAVQTIMSRSGAVPVIFITGTPDACDPCEPPGVVLTKPINEREVVATFREMAPL